MNNNMTEFFMLATSGFWTFIGVLIIMIVTFLGICDIILSIGKIFRRKVK